MKPSAHILVVDDEAHLAAGIAENLEAEGYRTDVAHDGLAGLERLRAEPFDLVLLDVMMPNMDGLELCARLRSEGRRIRPALRIAACPKHREDEGREER